MIKGGRRSDHEAGGQPGENPTGIVVIERCSSGRPSIDMGMPSMRRVCM
jgi:hypothetical protein